MTPVARPIMVFPSPIRTGRRRATLALVLAAAGMAFVSATESKGTNPAGMVLIPTGAFTMGDPFDEGEADERPTRTVAVSAFYLAKTHVTWTEWREVRDWAVSRGYPDLDGVGAGKADTHPVYNVSWHDVLKWLNARSRKEGLTPVYYTDDARTVVYETGITHVTSAQVKWNANGYRLPTEAEWEKAARGGLAGKRFPWGDTITQAEANYLSSEKFSYDLNPKRGYLGAYKTEPKPYTSPVGSFAANGYGLHDMAGNLWDWCWDLYGAYSGTSDPRGPTAGPLRVIRGGSWGQGAASCRVANRVKSKPDHRDAALGFRVARSSVP